MIIKAIYEFFFAFYSYQSYTAYCLWELETICRVSSNGAAVSPFLSPRVVARATTASHPIAHLTTRPNCANGSANCLSTLQLCASTAGALRSRRPQSPHRTLCPGNCLPCLLPLPMLRPDSARPVAHGRRRHRRRQQPLRVAGPAAQCARCERSETACVRRRTRALCT